MPVADALDVRSLSRLFKALGDETRLRIAAATSGCTWSAGCVPAEMACATDGSENWLKNASAIWERPALCTQAKTTLIGMLPVLGP
jgi:hypothetical protein